MRALFEAFYRIGRSGWLAVLALMLTGGAPIGVVHAQPNVLVILADDLGWKDVGYHGSEIRTPHLDALAAGGLALKRFYSQPTCTPTRAALLTGKSPQRLGIYRQFAKNSTGGLPTSERTLADYFSDAGYQTWLVGKWHLGHADWQYHPLSRGFDHFYGHVTGGIGHWDHVHGGGLDWQRNGTTVREDGYSTHLLADEAIALLRRRDKSHPFFLYASFNAPHLPNEAPAAAVESYAHIADPFRQIHAAMVTELDLAIGRLVSELEKQGALNNTVIWFMSDNGGLNPAAMIGGLQNLSRTLQDWLGAPLPITFLEFVRTNALEGGSDNGPLRFGKGSVYEGGARVPSLIHWPEELAAGDVGQMITVQDVLPTLLESVGLDVPPDLDGVSRWPLLNGEQPVRTNDYVTMGQNGSQAYYRWPLKLLTFDDRIELYDIERDPQETMDLADARPGDVAALRARLDNLPRADSLHIPIFRVVLDPDFFGGEEDRPPWADVMQNHQPTHLKQETADDRTNDQS